MDQGTALSADGGIVNQRTVFDRDRAGIGEDGPSETGAAAAAPAARISRGRTIAGAVATCATFAAWVSSCIDRTAAPSAAATAKAACPTVTRFDTVDSAPPELKCGATTATATEATWTAI